MAIQPRIPKQTLKMKTCAKCGAELFDTEFAYTHSEFYPDHRIPLCNGCVTEIFEKNGWTWDIIEKVCQWADIPFIVREWERLSDLNEKEKIWGVYSKVFAADCYKGFGWSDYQKQYQKLREAGLLEEEVPLLGEAKIAALRKKWGSNYDEEDLYYLEDLYKGLLLTQNVNGALQIDQAQKICKLSLEIDTRIRAGDKDVDKFLSSYDKLVKTAEFTPKNTKNAVDFDSFAEVGMWLEKRGHQNKFYDNVTRDVIDESLKNIENYNQRLYVNEGGIGEEITQRLQALKSANELEENVFDIQPEFDPDEYDNEGYDVEAFDASLDEDEEV